MLCKYWFKGLIMVIFNKKYNVTLMLLRMLQSHLPYCKKWFTCNFPLETLNYGSKLSKMF